MPKTIQVPLELKLEIRKHHAAFPEVSARKIAKLFGLHHKTVSRILKDEPRGDWPRGIEVPYNAPELTEKSELNDDTWTISMPKTRIQTLEELLEHCKVDLALWSVDRFVCNKWEMGAKDETGKVVVEPLFQIKAFLEKRKDVEAARNAGSLAIRLGPEMSLEQAVELVTRADRP